MDKQTTIGLLLIGAVFILWFYINSPSPEKQKDKKPVPTAVDTTKKQDTSKSPAVTQSAEKIDSLKYGRYFSVPSGNEQVITIENDLVILQLSTKGANLNKYYLKKFNNWYSADDEGTDTLNAKVQLINYSKGNTYDLSFVTSDGKAINTGALDFTSDAASSKYRLTKKDSLTITFTLSAGEGKSIQKVYTFFGDDYSIKNDIILNGMNNLISNNAYDIIWSNGVRFVEHNSVDEANYSNASVYYGDEQVIVDASDTGEKYLEDFNGRVDWIGARNKYFAAIIVPQNPAAVEGAYIEGNRRVFHNQGVKENYNLGLTIPFKNANYEKSSFLLYIGPVDYDILKTYGKKLEAIVDFGSFFGLKFIVRPIAEYILLPLFNFLHVFIPNYGFVIIVFSLIIKIVIYPLTKQSFQSMKQKSSQIKNSAK